MSTASLFRLILITSLIFGIAQFVASVSFIETLPQILQDYLKQEEDKVTEYEMVLSLIILLISVLLLSILFIGLWIFKSWARMLYVVLTVLAIPFYPFIGPVVMNGWEYFFSNIYLMLNGVLLTMMFTGEVSQKFRSSKINLSI